ncbi:MAG: phage head-tail adapter protein [Brevundimonas sp.]|uniref:phage head-tail adapter protein n=1 Tax=Brevundimonas sp. TaxID=1871086 RepID=UPI00391D72A0
MRKLAELLARVEGVTAQGGRAVSYEPLGFVWIAPGAARRGVRTGGEGVAEALTLTAECRADARLTEGRLLRWDGADWRIALVDAATPGRARLMLERDR